MKKKITILIIILLSVFTAFMMVKGIPMIVVNQMQSALEEHNGAKVIELYNTYSSYRFATQEIQDCVDDFINPIYDDFNNRFSDYQSREEMEKFLKDEYGPLFFGENNMYTEEPFRKLYSLVESKTEAIERKSELEEIEKDINETRNKMDNLYKLSDTAVGDAVLSERAAELLLIDWSLSSLSFFFDQYSRPSYLQDDTLYDTSYLKIESKYNQLQSEYNELQAEYDSKYSD